MTGAPVNLESVKKRMAGDDAAAAPAPTKPKGPVIRPEVLEEAARFQQEFERMNSQPPEEQKIDLGPLPEGVKVRDELDGVLYRDSTYDNKKVRKAVEARCTEMDFGDLVLTGRVSQTVPVLPKKLVFEFQSLTGSESYWVESRAQAEANTDWGLRSWVVWAQLTLSLVSVNGSKFPDHMGKDGEVDEKLFNEKRKRIMRLGAKILDIAVTNMNWFNDRVDRIFQDDFEQLGNG